MRKTSIIACIYDCDQTLIPEFMQEPMLRHLKVKPADFWTDTKQLREAAAAAGTYVNPENSYMINLLKYIEEKKIEPLSNSDLRNYGRMVTLYQGLPDFFLRTKRLVQEQYQGENITLEHYIISAGLRQMIEGSSLNVEGAIDGIFASEFLEHQGIIRWPCRTVGSTEKTRYLFEINKGVNVEPGNDVNYHMPAEKRRIPFENMIYVGDGFTDIPCMSLTLKQNGESLGVYDPSRSQAHPEAQKLLRDGRISNLVQADYRENGAASQAIMQLIAKAAERIIHQRRSA